MLIVWSAGEGVCHLHTSLWLVARHLQPRCHSHPTAFCQLVILWAFHDHARRWPSLLHQLLLIGGRGCTVRRHSINLSLYSSCTSGGWKHPPLFLGLVCKRRGQMFLQPQPENLCELGRSVLQVVIRSIGKLVHYPGLDPLCRTVSS